LDFSLTDRPINKPAQMPHLEFPSRAIAFDFRGALFYYPTGPLFNVLGFLHGEDKPHLSFDVNGNFSQTLFKTLYGLDRDAQQLGHFILCFTQLAPNFNKLFFVHLVMTSLLLSTWVNRIIIPIFNKPGLKQTINL
jgi:hypothetical protein